LSTPDDELPPDATVAARLSTYLRGGGLITPLITVLVAFIFGGLVVFATGHDPFSTYRAIFDGTGLNWLFPWTSADDRTIAALNLQQTLLRTAPLILAGLAVAFAFRCGLFNIGAARGSTSSARSSPSGSARPSRACRRSCTSCWRRPAARWRARSGRASPAR
jgi:hypothetical protein